MSEQKSNKRSRKVAVATSDKQADLELWGLPSGGTKKQVDAAHKNYSVVRGLKALIPTHQYSIDEVKQIVGSLMRSDPNKWDPADFKYRTEALNSHAIDQIAGGDPNVQAFLTAAMAYRATKFPACTHTKTKHITADALFNEDMEKLMTKKVSSWGDAEVKVILDNLADLKSIDGTNSTPASIQKYSDLCGKLAQFYVIRPDVKSTIDHDYVIFDLTAGVPAGYAAAIAALMGAWPPAVGAPVPHATGAGLAVMYAAPTIQSATYLIGHMRGAVAGLRAMLLNAPGAPVVY